MLIYNSLSGLKCRHLIGPTLNLDLVPLRPCICGRPESDKLDTVAHWVRVRGGG